MRNRIFHTSINLLIEAGLYQRLKMAAKLKKTSMCEFPVSLRSEKNLPGGGWGQTFPRPPGFRDAGIVWFKILGGAGSSGIVDG
jgi:hypothetical protein